MKIPTSKVSTPVLRNLGRWHTAALGQFEETRAIAPEFTAVQDALLAAGQQVEAAHDALLVPRMTLALAEIDSDTVLRKLDGACKVVDGGKGGATSKAVMPNGLTPEVAATGQRQVDAIDAIMTRAERRSLLTQATLAPVFAELAAVRGRLVSALASRKGAYEALAQVRVTETIAREDFCTAYSKDAGLIRSIYPNDAARREFFFDTFGRSAATVEDEEDPAVAEGGATVG